MGRFCAGHPSLFGFRHPSHFCPCRAGPNFQPISFVLFRLAGFSFFPLHCFSIHLLRRSLSIYTGSRSFSLFGFCSRRLLSGGLRLFISLHSCFSFRSVFLFFPFSLFFLLICYVVFFPFHTFSCILSFSFGHSRTCRSHVPGFCYTL